MSDPLSSADADLRSQVATLQAEMDAARRERDEALANARDYERDADIAEAQLSVVTAERDRLKAALSNVAVRLEALLSDEIINPLRNVGRVQAYQDAVDVAREGTEGRKR